MIIHGAHIGEAKEWAFTGDETFAEKTYINGYDDVEIIAGTGTLGIEMLEQVVNADVIVVPVGGGGLIAGIALAVKTLNPNVRVIGVEPRRQRPGCVTRVTVCGVEPRRRVAGGRVYAKRRSSGNGCREDTNAKQPVRNSG